MLRGWRRLPGPADWWGLPLGRELIMGLVGSLQAGGAALLGPPHVQMPQAAPGFATKAAAAGDKRGAKKRRSRRRSLSAAPADKGPTAGAPEVDAAAPQAAASSRARLQPLQELPARLLEDDEHPIRDDHISRPAWAVLLRLRGAGHEAYVVGGTVRDILLGRVPKDYDILTSAEPAQVRRLFSRSYIVGRTFPICHVHHGGVMMEVSSFSTNADTKLIPHDAATFLTGRHSKAPTKAPGPLDPAVPTWSAARRDNALHRDFTVNALLYEPFSRVVFDYVGGLQDCQGLVLRTIGDPEASFREDPARILRAVRLAARTGLELDQATLAAVVLLGPLVASLPQGRLAMELGALLGYGGAARSLELLWQHGLLHLLLPQHAMYLKAKRAAHDYRRRRKPELLFDLLRTMDAHVHPQRPLDPAVWLALLAAPLVAKECAALLAKAQRRRRTKGPAQVVTSAEPSGSVGSIATELLADLHAHEQQLQLQRESAVVAAAAEQQQQQFQQQKAHALPGDDFRIDAGWGPRADAAAVAGGGSSGEEGGSSQETSPSRRDYLEAYHQVLRSVMGRLLLPLDSATLRKLGVGEEAEGALRGAALGLDAATGGGKVSKPSRRQRRIRLQREEQRAAAALQAAAAVAGGDDEVDWAEGLAGATGAAIFGIGVGGVVLVPNVLPRGSVGKAVGLLLAEAELRGRPLPPLRGIGAASSAGGGSKAARGAEAGEEEADSIAQGHQHRQQLHQRKLSLEERLVAGVLREFGWQDLTQLPV